MAILKDSSGIDIAEFLWKDPDARNREGKKDGLFRCWSYQYPWYRNDAKKQIDQCGRAIGKSIGIQMRAYAFPFLNAGQEMLITAPEMIHLDPVTKYIEDRLLSTRISEEMLNKRNNASGITHRPFEAKFVNGAKIIGRIPQKDGKGVKGMHPRMLEMDEAQDYPPAGWVELTETLRYGDETSRWRAHGVSRGVRDHYYKLCTSEDWHTHRYTAMHRPDWTPEERVAKADFYGSREHPDYRRNILGLHGDQLSPLFVLHRLMACVDSNQESDYNVNEYLNVRLNDEFVRDMAMPIAAHIEIPGMHKKYKKFWIGMDVGLTNHPSEILVFAEEYVAKLNGATRLRCITRVHLERISAPQQIEVMEHLAQYYKPGGFGMDRTGLGLPIYQYCIDPQQASNTLNKCIRGYNFSEKIPVAFEQQEEDLNEWQLMEDDPMDRAIMGNVLEYSSDTLRLLVDQDRLRLPWDIDMLKEFQGQAFYLNRSSTNPYGKKDFNKGKFHALDAARMAALAFIQAPIEDLLKKAIDQDAVPLMWVDEPTMGLDPMDSGWVEAASF